MNIKSLTLASMLAISVSLNAANTKNTVTQVTNAVELSEDVDFVITSTDPFATAGSVNITNLEHGVVIFENIKPSKVTDAILSHIFINGEPAVKGDLTSKNATAGSNCQVRMYGKGSIVFPYSRNMKPLTAYSEQNYGGDTYDGFTEGHAGGYMKTLTASTFNNKIRSFKLKRGYMVTFAIGTGGWGYSRVFIADQEDLEIPTLPTILDGRISSYRIFKWWNAQKKGLASDADITANKKLNTSWCYDWAQGNESLLPDQEWVPNHIYEDWPSSATCGSVIGSCHMKTNNEPGNSADDHPQDVETILNNWENLMRTGMRLCSESSHDGSWSHLKNFISEIDKRGWRCDLLDLHCYWNEWAFNDFSGYYNDYGGRPIWISEWVWGASWNANNWNNGGIFSQAPDGKDSYSTKNQQLNYDHVKPILEKLNASKYIERYAYWNSEADASKIYRGGVLSILGNYYSEMNTGLAYNASMQKIPTATLMTEPTNLEATYKKSTNISPASVTLTWNDPNGDLLTTITVQCKLPGSSTWVDAVSVDPKDKSGKTDTYTAVYYPEESGTYTFRVREKTYISTTSFTTGETTVNVAPAHGSSILQFGKLSIDDISSNETSYSESMQSSPSLIIGTLTNKNASLLFGNYSGATSTTAKFTYQILPWKNNTYTMSKPEEVPFMSIVPGNYSFGNIDMEVGTVKSNKAVSNTWTDETVVTFTKPFPEGVKPVVLTEIKKPNYNTNSSLGVRIYDVTNTGFKFIVYSEDATSQKIALAQNINYVAITPGFECFDEENGIYIAAGHGTDNKIYGSSQRVNYFKTNGEEPEQLKFYSPVVFTELQTNNYPSITTLRRTDETVSEDNITLTVGTKVKRVYDHDLTLSDGTIVKTTTTAEEYKEELGWVVIANPHEGASMPTAISDVIADSNASEIEPYVVNGMIYVKGTADYKIYSASGAQVPNKTVMQNGIYIVKAGNKSAKIVIK